MTLVHHNQALYYRTLQDSNKDKDCRPFIEFMIDAIGSSLGRYIDSATETVADVGVNVGVNRNILELLKRDPELSAKELSTLLNKTTRTIERRIKELRDQGRLKRIGKYQLRTAPMNKPTLQEILAPKP